MKKFLIVLALFALTAGIGGAAYFFWDRINPFKPDPQKVLYEMQKNLVNLKGGIVRIDVDSVFYENYLNENGELTTKELTKSKIVFEEEMNFFNSSNPALNLLLSMKTDDLVFSSMSLIFGYDLRLVDKNFYVKISEFPLMPLSMLMGAVGSDFDLSKIGNTWVRISREDVEELVMQAREAFIEAGAVDDLDELEEALGVYETLMDVYEYLLSEEFTAEMKGILAKYPLLIAVEELPAKEIDSVLCLGYKTAIDKEQLKSVSIDSLKFFDGELMDKFKKSEGFGPNTARKKSRDAKRVADIKQAQTALELYFNVNQKYPDCPAVEFHQLDVNGCASGLENYLSNLKNWQDPLPDQLKYEYASLDGGSSYSLTFTLEDEISRYGSGKCTANEEGVSCNGEEVNVQADNSLYNQEKFDEDFEKMFQELELIEMEVWVGKKDRMPYKITYNTKQTSEQFVYSNDFSIYDEGKKMEVTTASIQSIILFSRHNQEIEITPPENPRPLPDFIEHLTGKSLKNLILEPLIESRRMMRDHQRLSDIKSVQAALAEYHNAYGRYPACENAEVKELDYSEAGCARGFDEFFQAVAELADPMPESYQYGYFSDEEGLNYRLEFYLEQGTYNLGSGLCVANPEGITSENPPEERYPFNGLNPFEFTKPEAGVHGDIQRYEDIQSLRDALEYYKYTHGAYPTYLNSEIEQYLGGLPEDPSGEGIGYFYAYLPGQSGQQYMLLFEMEAVGSDYLATQGYFLGGRENIILPGVNYATPDGFYQLSGSEALDDDGDLLINFLEKIYQTDPNKPDTDGDGHLDGHEVKNGYNPAGEGKLE